MHAYQVRTPLNFRLAPELPSVAQEAAREVASLETLSASAPVELN